MKNFLNSFIYLFRYKKGPNYLSIEELKILENKKKKLLNEKKKRDYIINLNKKQREWSSIRNKQQTDAS